VTGVATLVANSSTACPACIGDADVEVVVSGDCKYAKFTPVAAACADLAAVGSVTLATDSESCAHSAASNDCKPCSRQPAYMSFKD
jgi:hypothetical protein